MTSGMNKATALSRSADHGRGDVLQAGLDTYQSGEELLTLSDAAHATKAVVVRPLGPRESDRDYPFTIVSEGRARVIVCPDGIQWIVQRRRGDKWFGHSYCRRRDTLLRLCRDWSDNALAVLRSLPEWIEQETPLELSLRETKLP